MTVDPHAWKRSEIALGLEQGRSLRGGFTIVGESAATPLRPGVMVRVRCPGNIHDGALGWLAGFTVPHGYAFVDIGGMDYGLFHPETELEPAQ